MMKKLNLLLVLCIALLFTACATDIESIGDNSTQNGIKKKMVFTAEKAPIDPSSRATVQDDYSILWDEGDVIQVFDGTNKNTFTLVSGAGTTCAQFEGEALEADRYVAFYGYAGTCDNNTIKNLYYATNFVWKGYLKPLMLGISDSQNNILFKSREAYVKITTLEPTKKITVCGGENDHISGMFNLKIDDNGDIVELKSNVTVDMITKPYKKVYVDCNNEKGTFYLALAPTTLSELYVVVENESGSFYTRRISHAVHNFEIPGTVIDFGEVSVANGWNEILGNHLDDVCVQHYALGQGKEQAQQVDLDLPSGLKWSSVNLGATRPEKYGDYYAWGATVPWLESYDQEGNVSSITINDPAGNCKWGAKPQYGDGTCPFRIAWGNLATDYRCWSKYFPGRDDKTVLEAEDDAAVQQWGGGWRMPTDEELFELARYCYCEWTPDYKGTGIHGMIVYKARQEADKGIFHNGSLWKKVADDNINIAECTQPEGFTAYNIDTDTNIFLPQPGLCYVTEIIYSGEFGRYWSSTLSVYTKNFSYSNNARFIFFNSEGWCPVGDGGEPYNKLEPNCGRVYGQPIRPVHE